MRYVALLRGINLGGGTMVKMEELRNCFEGLGFENVKTYINSGNIGFDCRKSSEQKLCKALEEAVAETFGRFFSVIIREQKDIERILSNNPFDGEFESHKEMHVLFLKSEIPDKQLDEIRAVAPKDERFVAMGREIYLHLPMGVAESLMGRGLVEKKLKIAVTARNWRTVQKLSEL